MSPNPNLLDELTALFQRYNVQLERIQMVVDLGLLLTDPQKFAVVKQYAELELAELRSITDELNAKLEAIKQQEEEKKTMKIKAPLGVLVLIVALLALFMVGTVNVVAQDATADPDATAAATVGVEASLVPEPTSIVAPTAPAPTDTSGPAWFERLWNSPAAILLIVFGGILLIVALVIAYLLLVKVLDYLYRSHPNEAKAILGAAGQSGTNLFNEFQNRAKVSPEAWDDLVAMLSKPLIEQMLKALNGPPTTGVNAEMAAAIRARAEPAGAPITAEDMKRLFNESEGT